MASLAPWTLALTFLGCKACIGCFEPGMPSEPEQPHQGDTDTGVEDTGETAPPEDTTPPPPCEVPESEPNDGLDESDSVPLEATACGSFSEQGDTDRLVFPAEDAPWIRIDVDAASIGSAADVTFTLSAWDVGEHTIVMNSYDEEDPWILFPALGDSEYQVSLYESQDLHGEDYEWELLASEDKAPIDWNLQESDDNDLCKNAQTLTAGDVVLGWLDSDNDYDWYHVEVPASEDKINWTFEIEASSLGSPLAGRLTVWDELVVELDDVKFIATSFHDPDTSDPDPKIELSTEEEGDLYMVVQKPTFTGDPPGTGYHWYSLSISNDLE